MAAALFWRSARVGLRQPMIAKFLFHDGWVVCEIRWWTVVWDIIIKASALNKWTCYRGRNASVSERVCGGLTCQSPGSMLDNQQRLTVQRPLSPASHRVYSSPSMKEEQAKAACMTGASHTHPPHAVWRFVFTFSLQMLCTFSKWCEP